VRKFVELPAIRGRRVRAYVPDRKTAPRPLLVMFDGQNVFEDAGSFAGGWRVHEMIDDRAIVVALDHGGVHRIAELSPFAHPKHGGGKLRATLDAIVHDLVPMVDARFAISRRFIGGASLGGLASLHAHLLHPELFAGALAMSPSLWFTQRKVAALLHAAPRPASSRIYLDCGRRESDHLQRAIATFHARLERRGWSATGDHRVTLRVDARGKHHETSWRRRFPAALRFLFAE